MTDERCAPEAGVPRWIRAWGGRWAALLLVPLFLVEPVARFDDADPPWLGVLALVAVAGTALGALVLARRPDRRGVAQLLLVADAVVTVATVAAVPSWSILYTSLAISVAIVLPPRRAPAWCVALAVVAALAMRLAGEGSDRVVAVGLTTLFAGVGTFAVARLLVLVAELSRTRQQLADAAVAAERLRFGRDLHDLLGHTLSLIVVKAEAVRRLAPHDPAAAAAHAADIETVGRQALAEVREVVTGYRGTGLSAELAGAAAALSAAGIRAELPTAVPPLPKDVDSLLGWVVREGVTNVVRHAAARACRISVEHVGASVRLDVADDGAASHGHVRPGSGLTGLRERAAAAGGSLDASATSEGFRLAVTVPLPAASAPAPAPLAARP